MTEQADGRAATTIDDAIARADAASTIVSRETAALWAAIADAVDEAASHSEVFIDPRARLSDLDRREYAVRSALADLAVRLRVAETTVRAWGDAGRMLRTSAPGIWSAFQEGRVSPANARTAADVLAELPETSRSAFDTLVEQRATELAPARFRGVARAARDRVHEISVQERHHRAAVRRRFGVEDDLDGMSWLNVYLPSFTAHRASEWIESQARDIFEMDGEARTLDQIRADVAGDILMGTTSGGGTGVAVAVTVPVLTLLGSSDEPAILEGVGPIDAETARGLVGEATSFTRILTHPVTGAALSLDRTTYRVPADLTRALRHRDRTCRFAGCGRRAARCDIDHVTEWQDGGTTDAANLIHLCRHHHRLKSLAGWTASPPGPGSVTVGWTSPTGASVETEPPPY